MLTALHGLAIERGVALAKPKQMGARFPAFPRHVEINTGAVHIQHRGHMPLLIISMWFDFWSPSCMSAKTALILSGHSQALGKQQGGSAQLFAQSTLPSLLEILEVNDSKS